MLATEAPFQQFFDTDGSPLADGRLYFGAAGQNPETNPIAVFWDLAATQPAPQPIPTLNGFAVRNGSPAQVFVGSDYSMTVRNRRGELVYYSATSVEYSYGVELAAIRTDFANLADASKGSGLPSFDPTLNYAARTIGWAQKQSRWSVLWFNDVRTAVEAGTDCTAAVQAVYDLMISSGRRSLFFPAHPNGYVFNGGATSGDGYKNGILLRFTTVNADPATSIVIEGEGSTIFKCGANNMVLLRISRNNVTVRDITLDYNSKSSVILCGIVPEDMTQTTTLVSQSFVDLVNVGRVGGPGADGIVMQPGPHVGGADSGCFYHNVYGGYANFIGGGRHVHLKKNADWATVPNWVTRTNFFGQRLTRGNVGYQFDDGGQICLIGCNEEAINSGTTPSATPTARIIGPDCDGIQFFGGYSENCSKSVTMSANNVQSWGYVPASGSNTDWRTYARAWADSTDDDLSWTPVLDASGGGTQGAGTALGRLTKQGKTTSVTIQISLAKGTLSGNLSISGLPFVADTAWGSQNLEVTSWSGITLGTNYVKLNAVVSGAAITLQRQHGQGAGVAPLTVADCGDPIVLTIQGTFQAT